MHNIVIAFYQAAGGYGLYADVQVPNGTLQRLPNALLSGVATNNFQIGSLAGGGTVALGPNSLTVGGANHNASFTGNLTATSQTSVTKTGTGSQTIGQPNYGGLTTINSGTLQLGDGTHSISAIPAGTITDNGTLTIAIPTGATLAYSNAISGSGGLTVSGGGTLTLSGANTYTGPTLISGGIVNATNDSALGSNSDVTVAASATLNVPAVGSGGLAGTYYNSAPNNAPTYLFADTATVENYVAGLPVIATDRSSTANGQNNGGAVFDYGSSGQGFPSAVLANPNQFVAVWIGQFVAPTSGIYTFDTGSDDGSMLFLDGNAVVFNNAFQPLTVSSGSVPLTQGSHSIVIAYYQGGGQYGMYADVQVPGGALQRIPNSLLNTYANLQVGSLGGAGSVVIGGSNSLTVGGSNNNSTFSGILSGGGNLIKNGAGTMTLSGASDTAPSTTVNAGTLKAATIDGNGTTTINSGSSLIANHIIQSSLVIGGTAGSPATVTIAASDAKGNPLNAAATSDIRTAINGSTSAAQPAPKNTASVSAVPTATRHRHRPPLLGAADFCRRRRRAFTFRPVSTLRGWPEFFGFDDISSNGKLPLSQAEMASYFITTLSRRVRRCRCPGMGGLDSGRSAFGGRRRYLPIVRRPARCDRPTMARLNRQLQGQFRLRLPSVAQGI